MNAEDLAPVVSSRFQDNQMILYDGVETYGMWKPPWFIANPGLLAKDQVGSMVVTTGLDCRPDSISQQVYGTPYFDWVIIAFNKPQTVLNWPRTGTVIRYPLPEVVYRYLD